jgi:nicotinamide-nucleotide amidase
MKAHLLSIGDEILIGQIVNTNAAWIATELNLLGIEIDKMLTVGDRHDDIQNALEDGFSSADIILTTGGLGPTHDDITRNVIADYFGLALNFNEDIYLHIKGMLEKRGRKMSELNRVQAYVPEGFEIVPNPIGTAPGLWYKTERNGEPRYLVMMPGVPFEMKAIMNTAVLPRLKAMNPETVIEHKTLLTCGIGESNLAEMIGNVSEFLGEGATLAFLPSPKTGVKLRISVRGTDQQEALESVQKAEEALRSKVGKFIYGEGESLPEIVVGELLKAQGKTISVAESCTGGHITDRLTDISGSSAYLQACVIAYSYETKRDLLGVDWDDLNTFGAVSEQVVRQMAEGVRKMTGASIGLATTGIAGPTGDTPDKPVGTIWVGYSDENVTVAHHLQLMKDRLINKELTATYALDLVRRQLLGL